MKFDFTVDVEEKTVGTNVSSFPNPFTNEVEFKLSDGEFIEQLSLFDVTGKLVFQQAGIKSQTFTLERNQIEAGVYFYQVMTVSGKESTGKLVAN